MALGTTPLSARQLPPDLSAIAGPAARTATYITTRERVEGLNRPPLELTIVAKAEAAPRTPEILDSAKRALAMLDDWLGPLPIDRLTIVDVPTNRALAAATPRGIVIVRSRWLTQARDRSLEREIIAGLTRQYWLDSLTGDQDWFVDGLSMYTAGRAIDTLLQGSHFYADRFFGGFVPYALRSVSLSPAARDVRPRLRRYDELDRGTPAAERAARAIEVAERYLGWPAVQQALETFRQRSMHTPAEFLAIASEQRGTDLSWLFGDMVSDGKSFDYALSGLESRPTGGGYDVRLTIDRRGDAVFARSLPVETRFADGTSIRDRWDAAAPQSSLEYTSTVPAIAATIDPELILILDEDRSNNSITRQEPPWNRLALKLACDWAIWLQNLVVTYSGIV